MLRHELNLKRAWAPGWRSRPALSALTISLMYLLVGVLWIKLTDAWVAQSADSVGVFATLSTYKGWLFILVTAILLFLLIRRKVQKIYGLEDQRQASDERFRALFEEAAVGIAIVDLDGRMIETNRAIQQMLGYSGAELAERTFTEITHPDDLPASLDRFHALIAGRPAINPLQKRYLRKDGQAIWVRNTSSVARDAVGAAQYVLLVSENITDRLAHEAAMRQAKDAAESANKAKDQFLSVLSHELRTPLTPVLANVAAMVADRRFPKAFAADLQTIRRNVELEARLIDDLLDLTRITRGRLQMKLDPVDVHVLLRSAMEMCSSDLAEKRLEVKMDMSAERFGVRGDAARLLQVFWNLLRNAIKFTAPGGHIAIRSWNESLPVAGKSAEPGVPSLSTSEPAALSLSVSITDTGIGISAEALGHVFEALSDRGRSAGRQFGGVGLGLAISQAIVALHGGTLTAQSQGEGRGATFTLALPAADLPAPAPAPPPRAPAAAARAGAPRGDEADHRPTILLVEDHADTARSLSRLLRMSGYQVTLADCVRTAVEAAEHTSFDLLLSDIALPDGTGVDVLQRLTREHAVKAIAMSGFGMDADIHRSLEAGFIEHLTKPIDFDRLERLMREVLSNPQPASAGSSH